MVFKGHCLCWLATEWMREGRGGGCQMRPSEISRTTVVCIIICPSLPSSPSLPLSPLIPHPLPHRGEVPLRTWYCLLLVCHEDLLNVLLLRLKDQIRGLACLLVPYKPLFLSNLVLLQLNASKRQCSLW